MFNSIRKWFYLKFAEKSMIAGNSARAEKWYKKLESIEPENVEVLHNLGLINISHKCYSDAEKYLLKEIDLTGDSDSCCTALGDLYFMEGKREKAGYAYNRALSLVHDGSSEQRRSRYLRRKIKHCRDDISFQKAMDGVRFYEEGSEYYTKGNYGEALDLYYKAVECDSSSIPALNAVGTLQLNYARDYDSARKYFKKALDLSDMPFIRNNLIIAENKIRESGGEL